MKDLFAIARAIAEVDAEFSSAFDRSRALAKRFQTLRREREWVQAPVSFDILTKVIDNIRTEMETINSTPANAEAYSKL